MEKKKIVFLYSELATYFLACIEKLSQQADVEIHIVRWAVNKDAPFHFSLSDAIRIYDRNSFLTTDQLQELIVSIHPSVIYCSGWVDKGYLKICRQFKKKIPVIVGFDNQWKATIKQWIAVLISPFKIANHFSHCWVPGVLQMDYAIRLGFPAANILAGFYACDFEFFYKQYLANKEQKEKQFPKRFIYVGRYVQHKGIGDLWKAFIELQVEQPNEWELWCMGTGDVKPVDHPKIKHFGFVQPAAMIDFIKDTGVFILPSHAEPWGVVIHEFAAAGFPIICSDEVGARTTFVEDNLNGYIYASGNVEELKSAMARIINSSEEKLNGMSQESVSKAKLITPEIWAKQLISLVGIK
jgi:glycosyltransferase involved in cell wall biosynthesis